MELTLTPNLHFEVNFEILIHSVEQRTCGNEVFTPFVTSKPCMNGGVTTLCDHWLWSEISVVHFRIERASCSHITFFFHIFWALFIIKVWSFFQMIWAPLISPIPIPRWPICRDLLVLILVSLHEIMNKKSFNYLWRVLITTSKSRYSNVLSFQSVSFHLFFAVILEVDAAAFVSGKYLEGGHDQDVTNLSRSSSAETGECSQIYEQNVQKFNSWNNSPEPNRCLHQI